MLIFKYLKSISLPIAGILVVIVMIAGTAVGFRVLSNPAKDEVVAESGNSTESEQNGISPINAAPGSTDAEDQPLAETTDDNESDAESEKTDSYTNSVKEGASTESDSEQKKEESSVGESEEESGGGSEDSGQEEQEEEEEESGPTGPTLAWAEEFNGPLNTSFWTVEHSTYGDGNGELQCYAPSQVAVADGKLKLTAIEQSTTCPNGDVRAVTSGMVRSKNVSFEPGQYIEWSVKLTPNDQNNQGGLWPAFWASGWAGGGWPNGGEWDGFEVMTAVDPTRTVYSLHFANSSGVHEKTSTPKYSAVNFSQNTHTFKFEYGADGTLVWYRDNFETKRVTSVDTLQGYPAPFDQDMKSFKINLALGGSPGPLDMLALPATYEVGYVRIYDMNN